MALKGQKFNKYSRELKEEILNQYLEGISSHYLANKYEIIKKYQTFLKAQREKK